MRKFLVDCLFDFKKGFVDGSYGLFQIVKCAVFLADGFFPVPLVDVERVDVVKILECADGVHVGIEAVAGGYVIGSEFVTFPFGQRVDHFGFAASHRVDGE